MIAFKVITTIYYYKIVSYQMDAGAHSATAVGIRLLVQKRIQLIIYAHTVWFLHVHELSAVVVYEKAISIFFDSTRGNIYGSPVSPLGDHISPLIISFCQCASLDKVWHRGHYNHTSLGLSPSQ